MHSARPLDVRATLAPLRHGPLDPTVKLGPGCVWRAAHTPDGPVTMYAGNEGADVVIRAWGPGADWTLAGAPDLVGLADEIGDTSLWDPTVKVLAHRMPGLRIGRTRCVVEALIPTIIEQKVTSSEAHRSWSRLARAWGAPAPGPPGLLLPPAPERLAAMPYFAFHRFGIERRRADFVRGAAARAAWLERAADMSYADAWVRLQALPGIGPWTAGHVMLEALGDPDAVVVGDYHLPHLVGAALAGERRATDERMLELLEPYRGQRGRVQRLIAAGVPRAPNTHLRRPRRDFARF